MTASHHLWDRAAGLVAVDGRRFPAKAALPPGLPTVGELFDFMRDAELRFETLRMRIVEVSQTARGEQAVETVVQIRHPGHARGPVFPVHEDCRRGHRADPDERAHGQVCR